MEQKLEDALHGKRCVRTHQKAVLFCVKLTSWSPSWMWRHIRNRLRQLKRI